MKLDSGLSNEELAKKLVLPAGTYSMALLDPSVNFTDSGDREFSSYFFKFGWTVLGKSDGKEFAPESPDGELNGWYETTNSSSSMAFFLVNKDGSKAGGMESALATLKTLGIPQSINDPGKFKDFMEKTFIRNADDILCVYALVKVRHFERQSGAIGMGFDIMSRIVDEEIVKTLDITLRKYYSAVGNEIPF